MENVKTLKSVNEGDIVRLLAYRKDSINAYARVADIKTDRILLSNRNIPFQGTISRYFTKLEFERLTKRTF